MEGLSSIFSTLTTDYIKPQLEVVWGGGSDGKVEQLEQHLLKIRSIVADAEEKQIIDAAVRTWLHALKKVAYEAEDVLDEFNNESLRREAALVEAAGKKKLPFLGKVADLFSPHNPIMNIRLNLGPKLNNILEKINKLEVAGEKFNFNKFDVANSYMKTVVSNETWSFVNEEDVVVRQEDKEQIVSMLINRQRSKKRKQSDMLEEHNSGQCLSVLPIVGLGGVGKTTMAQLVYNDARVRKHFPLQGWVCVSDTWDLRKIIQDLVASLTGVSCDLPTLELMQRRLREVLASNRYLVVLDDVWNEDQTEWDRLKGLLNHVGGDGSAVVVTTRSERVSEIMGTSESYPLKFLKDEEAWTLFSNRAFGPGVAKKPEELVRIGMDIVKKCGGLPLALKMIGSLLYMKSDRSEWLKIKDSDMWNLETNILPALWLSYKHLPPHSKQCFAFCAVFPKDYEMEKESLIQMWMAHGFIPCDGGLEVTGREIFNQLVQRSFLHNLKKERDPFDHFVPRTTCRMHDLVHDLAKSIVGNECMTTLPEGSHEDAAPKDVYHLVSLKKLDVKKTLETFPSLWSLLIMHYNLTAEISRYTFLRALKLRVSVTGLQISIKFLQHLRYLDLSYTDIQELPEATSSLLNLQTLILSGCRELCRLSESMRCMISLRHLYLDECYRLRKMPEGMGLMTNLQILTMYIVDNAVAAGRGIGELRGLQLSFKLKLYNLRYVKDAVEAREVNLHSKQDLQHLELCWKGADVCRREVGDDTAATSSNEENEMLLEELRPPNSIKLLKIWDYNGLNFPRWMADKLLLQQLVELHMGYCTRLSRLPPLWQLKSLEMLSLEHLDNLKYVISDSAGDSPVVQAFPLLRELRLRHLGSLEYWWENNKADHVQAMASNCFPALVRLEIKKCPELTGLMPLGSSLKSFELVESNKIVLRPLHLEGLENLTLKVFEQGALTGFALSRLVEMQIDSSDWIFSDRFSKLWRSMISLESLFIRECHALVDLPEVLRGLNSLRFLYFRSCDNLDGPVSSNINPYIPQNLEELRFSSCERLTAMPSWSVPASLKSLRFVNCRNLVSVTAAAGQDLVSLTSLEELHIWGCINLKSFGSGMERLTALRILCIVDCPELTILPQGLLQRLSALKCLYLEGCPELEEKCRRGGEYWGLVSHIPTRLVGDDRSEWID